MDAPDKAVEIKAAFAALTAAVTTLLGRVGWLLAVWLITMLLDYLTGTFAAIYGRRWSSTVARQGLWHKLGSIFAVLVAALCDIALGALSGSFELSLPLGSGECMVTSVVIGWYIFTELGSIIENAAAMGAPVPAFLKKLLAKLKSDVESKGGDGE